MGTQCEKHQFEQAEGSCRTCGFDFCAECLVFAFGPKEPPYCIPCALAASGVRSNAARRPNVSKREVRRKAKARRKAERAEEQATPRIEVRAVEIDWSIPSDAEPTPELDWSNDDLLPEGERVPF